MPAPLPPDLRIRLCATRLEEAFDRLKAALQSPDYSSPPRDFECSNCPRPLGVDWALDRHNLACARDGERSYPKKQPT
jgi:hypothetical protein